MLISVREVMESVNPELAPYLRSALGQWPLHDWLGIYRTVRWWVAKGWTLPLDLISKGRVCCQQAYTLVSILPAPYDSFRHDSSSPGARCGLVLKTEHHGQKSLHLLLVDFTTVVSIISKVHNFTFKAICFSHLHSKCPGQLVRNALREDELVDHDKLSEVHIAIPVRVKGPDKISWCPIVFLGFHKSYLKSVSRNSFDAMPGGKNLLNWLKLIIHTSSEWRV